MAMRNPKGRANYEPNSWGGDEGGPREDPANGFRTFPAEAGGAKRRLRAETFADHYSQARQFYISQTEVEQRHIADALVFELSKVERADIRDADGRRTCSTSTRTWPQHGGRRAAAAGDARRRRRRPGRRSRT